VKVLEANTPENRILVKHLEKGVYLLRISTENGGVYTGKVLKQ
jgi:hypothetical protein